MIAFGYSGWMVLVLLIPLVGAIYLAYLAWSQRPYVGLET